MWSASVDIMRGGSMSRRTDPREARSYGYFDFVKPLLALTFLPSDSSRADDVDLGLYLSDIVIFIGGGVVVVIH